MSARRRRRESTADFLARMDREAAERAAATRERNATYARDYPIREDLHPLVCRMQDAQLSLSRMRELGDHLPLVRAAAAGAVEAAKRDLAAAARASGTKGIRVPMMLPDRGFYVSVDGGSRT